MDRSALYKQLLKQATALVEDEPDFLASAANLCALLHEGLGNWWTGFYFVKEKELVLGPFQGPVACTRIAKGKGVCGQAWENAQTLVVEDVHSFPGHIACSPASNSEIVVPLSLNGQVLGVLDLDSTDFRYYSAIDAKYLPRFLELLAPKWKQAP